MPFSEKIKLEVKRKAAFRCCRCHEIGVDIHHMIPQSDGGSDDIDNAAPLCQNCHDRFGSNPEKQKEIRQMRDWWYEVVKEKYSSKNESVTFDINELILKMESLNGTQLKEMAELKSVLLSKIDSLKPKMEALDKKSLREIRQEASQYITATTLAKNVHANFRCAKCNTTIGLLVGSSRCPNCGEII